MAVYSASRAYRSSWGVRSFSAARSFVKPPATMFRYTRRPCRNASEVTIFATL